jgi:hypothetical protein
MSFFARQKNFLQTWSIFDGIVGEIRYLGGDDYKGMLERIRQTVQTEKNQLDALRGQDGPA